jgi:hypothetical protein
MMQNILIKCFADKNFIRPIWVRLGSLSVAGGVWLRAQQRETQADVAGG